MLPTEDNKIVPNPGLEIIKIEMWDDELKMVFLEVEEPWEIEVDKTSLYNPHSWMLATRESGKTIGLLYGHISDIACRGDYHLLFKLHRRIGAGRTLFHAYVEWCK